jgi:chitinase
MKKLLLLNLIAIMIIASCSKDDIPDVPDIPEEEEEPYNPSPAVDGRIVSAYVTYWGKSIPDARVITHLNYAFAELYMRNGEYQGFRLQGNQNRFEQITQLKEQNPDLKILVSFTHVVDNPDNVQGGGFSALAKSDEHRKAFAQDCKAFIESWGIDGVDIDWEFPGISWSGAASDPAVDTQNHALLMKQLRETLGDEYLITYAGYVKDKVPVQGGYRYIDIKAVDQYTDFVNLMTYNMDAAPKHHSALSDSRAYWDCLRTVNAYKGAGVPEEKLVLGIPFYGQHSFSEKPTSLNYNTIINLDKSIYKTDNWDPISSTPYVTKNGVFFCGYDNPKSIEIKGEWALSSGLPGLMYWQYDADDAKGTLRKAVWETVMTYR